MFITNRIGRVVGTSTPVLSHSLLRCIALIRLTLSLTSIGSSPFPDFHIEQPGSTQLMQVRPLNPVQTRLGAEKPGELEDARAFDDGRGSVAPVGFRQARKHDGEQEEEQ